MHPILKLYEKLRWFRYPIGVIATLLMIYVTSCPPVLIIMAFVALMLHLFLPAVATQLAKDCRDRFPNKRFQLTTAFHFLPIGLWTVYIFTIYFIHSIGITITGHDDPAFMLDVALYTIGAFSAMTTFYLCIHLESSYRKARKGLK